MKMRGLYVTIFALLALTSNAVDPCPAGSGKCQSKDTSAMLQSRMLVDEENLNQESQDDVVGDDDDDDDDDDDGDDDDDDSPKKKGYDKAPKAAELRKPGARDKVYTIKTRPNGKLRGRCPDKKMGWMEGEVKGAELKETKKRMNSEGHCIKMAFKENGGKAAGAWIRHSGNDKRRCYAVIPKKG